MKNYFWLLDNGHGGVINGVPQTAGKRSPDWDKGVLYEGESNRRILSKVKKLLDCDNINNTVIVPELKDISLSERVSRINSIARTNAKCIALSFHSDGFSNESAHGWSAFTTRGETKSDKVADVLYKHAKKASFKLRFDYSDGDSDKEANFYILKNTSCPAVLIENFFMTNKKDYNYLMSEKGQNKIARVIFNAIKEVENVGI
jgi:N-acetylmuramoyl-L-alanine amidase